MEDKYKLYSVEIRDVLSDFDLGIITFDDAYLQICNIVETRLK